MPLIGAGMLVVGWAVGPSSSTETRYCEMGREMLVSGDWIVPTFNGAPLLEKPPFEYWTDAAAMAVFGINDVAPRVPHLLAAALVLLVVAVMARRFAPEGPSGAWRGRLAAVVLGTTASFVLQSYAIVLDVYLLLVTTLAGWALLEADRVPGKTPLRWSLLLYASLGLAMLIKGPLSLALVGAAALVTAAIRRRAHVLRVFASPLGVLVFAAIAIPWYLALEHRIPGILSDLVQRRLFGGLASSADFHKRPWWTVWLPFAGTFPWLAVVPHAVLGLLRTGRWRDGPGLPLALLGLAAPVLFTFSASRLPSYASPAYPFLAVLVALGVPGGDPASRPVGRARMELVRATLGMAAAALAAVVAGIVFVQVGAPFVAALVVVALVVLAVVFLPKPFAWTTRPVGRAAAVVALFLTAGGLVASASPATVGSVKSLWTTMERRRKPEEPYAVFLNDTGDWGIFAWSSRKDVLFFGYATREMMVPPEKYRPDLFRPEAELADWLRRPGRRWLLIRPRERRYLHERNGIDLTVVAAAHEYELTTTVPLDTP